ncbi:formate/nitrite transporter family protein [Rahnella victoriana]|jgi:formate/nitrite transporter FocA (FNT family)|uniref:Formate/nitrite transporter family protein n=1 Tax=Rahnella victoriana TaxID=1510570 RepID=A0ABS0DSM2_9GAMM|nr:formate/nitrite transporter family protein [Rahnella victoriana]MBF7956625.1 formate/nitrite transporter family protein [Rahnella victoriana]
MTEEKKPRDDNDVDSDEHAQGKEIETGEENLPSKAAAVHEVIRMEGEKELERDGQALLWSAIAAGLSISASLMAKGILHARLPDTPERFFIENLGYTVGFIIVIMARQQLFTENTVTAVLPIMQKPTGRNILLLLRLWAIVLAGNVIGGGLAALVFHLVPFFDTATDEAFRTISLEIMEKDAEGMFVGGMVSGWLIATMVWMIPSAGTAKLWVIMLMTYMVAIGDLTHIVVGSVEILYLVFSGAIPWYEFIWPFALPTLAGNIFGGTFIFALISHAQIRNDMSNQKKAKAKKEEREAAKKEAAKP